ncbi:aspartate--tRNA(Asn) ligase [Candidatus Kaiserbacteria bacterium CG10_big_fil_rev_8_21_14_0_10_49_17]|uniref:Aspartate--tRNA ligase n=1 Tax=Candidatus Kaiserbacteria bacterium CG10_big_fil_rev_8_21_14_0_10_49_17 TaxID=1974609 RepID=A0A2M6WF77_9BACT|nr:MAG: aspartate--tRNA(Asn) ligase [Candidatus Kaiserbacteria bacterium CG10_big_fil_rev_8_21_14_0_10_49_17]
MERIRIKDIGEHIGKEVTVAGWVSTRRDHGKLIFFDLRDRSGEVQAVALPNHTEAHTLADTIRPEWVITVTAKVNERPEKMIHPDAALGHLELEVMNITVLSEAAELPFDIDAELNIDTYLNYLPLTLRTQRGRDIFKVQETLIETFRTQLRARDFTEFQAPAIVGGDAEGGANVFRLDYFNDRSAYLATSPQLYKQILVGIYERVFATPKVFRAEPHATSRHLNEYSSLDFELGFIEDHRDVMAILTELIRAYRNALVERHSDVLERFNVSAPAIPDDIPVVTLAEGQEIVTERTDEDCVGEPDLSPAHEEALCEYAREKHNSDFIYVTHYPVSKRPFYTYEDESTPGFTKSFDLLFRGVEITTGGQRIHSYEQLLKNMQKWNLDPNAFRFYLQAFAFGMPPHGGCATGLERLTAKMLGIRNVKEATLFPRDMNRIDTQLSE